MAPQTGWVCIWEAKIDGLRLEHTRWFSQYRDALRLWRKLTDLGIKVKINPAAKQA